MNRAGIAFLCLRLAAILLWLHALEMVASFIPWAMRHGSDDSAITQQLSSAYSTSMLISPPILIIAGIVLFIWAPVLSRRLFPDASSASAESPSGIEGLALRLLGIYVWSIALDRIPGVVIEAQRVDPNVDPATFYSTLAIAIALSALGTWLFFSGPRIARWLLRASSTASTGLSVRVQTIAFSIAGLLLLAEGLPDAVTMVVTTLYRKLDDSVAAYGLVVGRFRPEGWIGVARIVLGLALFFGSHGLSVWWHRVRSAGIAASRREPENKPG